jgi:hypothetical protein
MFAAKLQAPPTNKKHACKFCKNEYYKACIGPHLFNHHANELRAALDKYKTRITKPSLPLQAGDLFVCLCCSDVWTTAGRATAPKHMAKCSVEEQIKALYAFLDCDAPTAEITVRVPVAAAVKEAEAENILAIARKCKAEDELQKRKSEFQTKTKRLEQKIAYLEYRYVQKCEVLATQRDLCFSRLSATEQHHVRKEVNEIDFDYDTKHEFLKLREDIELYVDNTFNDSNLKIAAALAPEPAPVPEPEPEPLPVPVPEPAPAPQPKKHKQRTDAVYLARLAAATLPPTPEPKPAPEPPHNPNECPVCLADYMEWDRKTTCVNCKNTCHFDDDVTGCGTMECMGCAGQTCKTCWRACGSIKLKPYCSRKCKDPQDAIYLESRQGVKYVPKSPA